MSYLQGEELSRSSRGTPAACGGRQGLREILRFLSLSAQWSTASRSWETVDISYFRKIENRLDLCRRTAPRTFSPELLDTERIIINGVYLPQPHGSAEAVPGASGVPQDPGAAVPLPGGG